MRLIATDLDGTLLNERGLVSEENAAAIKKAIDHGLEFVVATGRSFDAANIPLQRAGIKAPVISLNGANTSTENKKLLRDIPMADDHVKEIYAQCREKDIYFEVFTNEGVFSTSREYFLQVMIDVIKSANPTMPEDEIRKTAELRFQFEEVEFINSYDTLLARRDIRIYKILAFSMEKSRLKQIHNQLKTKKDIVITSSGDINLEINHAAAHKGAALEEYVKSLGIEMADVMALGDNLNDASMLKLAGRSVAMGNALPEIKVLCDITTKRNTENGVAVAIEEMLAKMNY